VSSTLKADAITTQVLKIDLQTSETKMAQKSKSHSQNSHDPYPRRKSKSRNMFHILAYRPTQNTAKSVFRENLTKYSVLGAGISDFSEISGEKYTYAQIRDTSGASGVGNKLMTKFIENVKIHVAPLALHCSTHRKLAKIR
jgi:hypothetical protein